MSLRGKPVSILTINSDETFTLDEDALRSVLNNKNVRNKPVCLVPVAGESCLVRILHNLRYFLSLGAFRKGKSFLLNFLLRYLNAEGSDDWLEKTAGEELSGFHWCGGSQRDTTGVLIWSEIFTVVSHTGEEVAVVLMDTQVIRNNATQYQSCKNLQAP